MKIRTLQYVTVNDLVNGLTMIDYDSLTESLYSEEDIAFASKTTFKRVFKGYKEHEAFMFSGKLSKKDKLTKEAVWNDIEQLEKRINDLPKIVYIKIPK